MAMNKLFKKIVSVACCAALVFPFGAAADDDLGPQGAVSGLKYMDTTPEDNIFSVDGQKFVLLDTFQNGGEAEFYVSTYDYYGTHVIDSTGADGKNGFDVSVETNIAYWLNNGFLESGNGGKKLSAVVTPYIRKDTVWNVEAKYGGEASQTVCAIGLLSAYEYKKYIGKIGNDALNGEAVSYLRTPLGTAAKNVSQLAIGLSGGNLGKIISSNIAKARNIRPTFVLKNSFFSSVELDEIGGNVINTLSKYYTEQQMSDLYKTRFKDLFADVPVVKNLSVEGSVMAGETVSAKYDYMSFIADESEISWLVADSADGVYSVAATGRTFTISDEYKGKYIKLSVLPKHKYETASEPVVTDAFGPVKDPMDSISDSVAAASASEIGGLISGYSSYFTADYDSLTEYQKHLLAMVVYSSEFSSFSQLDRIISDTVEKIKDMYADTYVPSLSGKVMQSVPVKGSVAETPKENLFSVDGTEFILLDGESGYIMAKNCYGTAVIDTKLARYSAEVEGNIANVLNRAFLINNTASFGASEAFLKNLDWLHVWYTEPGPNDDSTTKTFGGAGLLSATELEKYAGIYGADSSLTTSGYWLRTPSSGGTERSHLGSFFATPGAIFQSDANGSPRYVRPAFYVNDDFFANVKITNAGKNVKEFIASKYTSEQLKGIYTDAELAAIFPKPTAENLKIGGMPVSGGTLKAEYTYSSEFDEGDTAVLWFASDNASSGFVPVGNGRELVLTAAMEGKYIRLEVTPKSVISINGTGDTSASVLTEKIRTGAEIKQIVSEVEAASADDVLSVLTKYNGIFGLDLALSDMTDAQKSEVMLMFANTKFETAEELVTEYEKSAAIVRLKAEDTENISSKIRVLPIGIDLTGYDRLEDTSDIDSYIKNTTFNSNTEFENGFAEKVLVKEIQNAERDSIKELLLYYADRLDARLKTTGDYNLGIVGTAVLDGKKDSLSDIVSSVKTAIDGLGGGTSGGDGGTGGGGGGGAIKTPSEVIDSSKPGSSSYDGVSFEPSGNTSDKSSYKDLAGFGWAEQAINTLSAMNILNGSGNGEFRPGDAVTREQFAKMLVTAFGLTSGETVSLSDAKDGDWYYPYICAAYKNGIVNGINDTEFGVGSPITREDMAVMIYRCVKAKAAAASDLNFADSGEISAYAKEAVGILSKSGIVNGMSDNTFAPKQTANRAMAAVMVYRALQYR